VELTTNNLFYIILFLMSLRVILAAIKLKKLWLLFLVTNFREAAMSKKIFLVIYKNDN